MKKNEILINSKSIKDIYKIDDEESHIYEINEIYEELSFISTNRCIFNIKYFLPDKKETKTIVLDDNNLFSDIDTIIDTYCNYKNGSDFFIDKNNDLLIRCYDNFYFQKESNEYKYITTDVHITVYDTNFEHIDISKVLLNLKERLLIKQKYYGRFSDDNVQEIENNELEIEL